MKSALVICRGGFIGTPKQQNEGTEVLLPTEYSNYTPKDAQHGHDSESNVLLPCFMNGMQHDTSEGQHGKNNQNRR